MSLVLKLFLIDTVSLINIWSTFFVRASWLTTFFYLPISVSKRKTLAFGALPTLNLPKKAIHLRVEEGPPRRELKRVIEEGPIPSRTPTYQSSDELSKRVKKLTIKEWNVEYGTSEITLTKKTAEFTFPEIQVKVDDGLGFSISVLCANRMTYRTFMFFSVYTKFSNV